MAFNPLSALLAAEARMRLGDRPMVVELGNQTFDVGDDVLVQIRDQLRANGVENLIDETRWQELRALEPGLRPEATADYFRALGFAEYTAIDINSRYGSLVMDLNLDLETEYGFSKQFDLVTNCGTGEHIFNQAALFKNMHALARPGGLLLFVLPFQGWINHGFYNFHPGLIADLATANDYLIEQIALANRWAERITLDPAVAFGRFDKTINAPLVDAVHQALARFSGNVFVVAMLRKTVEKPFRAPIQGVYVGNIESDEIRARYRGPRD